MKNDRTKKLLLNRTQPLKKRLTLSSFYRISIEQLLNKLPKPTMIIFDKPVCHIPKKCGFKYDPKRDTLKVKPVFFGGYNTTKS
jgi:hypothetical protein